MWDIFIVPGNALAAALAENQIIYFVQGGGVAAVSSFVIWMMGFQLVFKVFMTFISRQVRTGAQQSQNAHSQQARIGRFSGWLGMLCALCAAPFIVEYGYPLALEIGAKLSAVGDIEVAQYFAWALLLVVTGAVYLGSSLWLQGVMIRRQIHQHQKQFR